MQEYDRENWLECHEYESRADRRNDQLYGKNEFILSRFNLKKKEDFLTFCTKFVIVLQDL